MNNIEAMNVNSALRANVEIYEERVQVLDSLMHEALHELSEAQGELAEFLETEEVRILEQGRFDVEE